MNAANWTATHHRVKKVSRERCVGSRIASAFVPWKSSLEKNINISHQAEFTWPKTAVRQESDLNQCSVRLWYLPAE